MYDLASTATRCKVSLIRSIVLLVLIFGGYQVLQTIFLSSFGNNVANDRRVGDARKSSYDVGSATGSVPAVTIEHGPQPAQLANTRPIIYLLEPSTNRTAKTTWGDLSRWNRTSQYDDIFQSATSVLNLPSIQSAATTNKRRVVVLINCNPKMGSTTLRRACRMNLEYTCGKKHRINRGKAQTPPMGYTNRSALFPLIASCTNTSHFCARKIIMPSLREAPAFVNTTFLHAFPFRQYDEWAESALRETYVNGLCDVRKSEFETCQPSIYTELDFRQYSKYQLSRFRKGVMKREMEIGRGVTGEEHMFLLYHHRELHDVLSRLSDVYGVPLLPGSDWLGNDARPEGTCDIDILERYHECFSSELMKLP